MVSVGYHPINEWIQKTPTEFQVCPYLLAVRMTDTEESKRVTWERKLGESANTVYNT